MKQDKHWDYILEGIEKLFNEEFLFVREHAKQMLAEGRLLFHQDDQTSMEVAKDNLIYAIEAHFEHKLNSITEKEL